MNWLTGLIPSPLYGWVLLGAFALGAAGAGATAWKVRGWQADATINRIKADWQAEKTRQAEAIARSTQEARTAEAKARALANQIEVQHHELSQTTERLLADNRRLARQLGGLRDPGTRPGCTSLSGTAQAAGDTSNPATGAELSEEATEFLLEFAAQADRAADYAWACHEWAVNAWTRSTR